MRAWALILAAGEGSRMAQATGGLAKQFLLWKGLPLYWHTAQLFSRCARIAGLVFVFPPSRMAEEQARLADLNTLSPLGLPWIICAGGKLRQDSVRNGLLALPTDTRAGGCEHVLIHDTARPFASPELVNRVLDALNDGAQAVIPGIVVTDTIKVLRGERVAQTPERSTLRAIQTPQGFHTEQLLSAHKRAVENAWIVTDDAALIERMEEPVHVIDGERTNIKITNPEDLAMLEHGAACFIPRTGFGYDVHRYVSPDSPKARPLRIGGVAIPSGPLVQAHSDGDVLLHALADALLACCAQGDIGRLFPDSDPACDAMHSAIIVDEALARFHNHALRLTYIDMTVIAQIPKMAPYWMEIRNNVARLLHIDVSRVSLKATTEEGLGFTGAKEGIKAVVVASAVETAAGLSHTNK